MISGNEMAIAYWYWQHSLMSPTRRIFLNIVATYRLSLYALIIGLVCGLTGLFVSNRQISGCLALVIFHVELALL